MIWPLLVLSMSLVSSINGQKDGIIGDNLVIRPLPARVHKEVLPNNPMAVNHQMSPLDENTSRHGSTHHVAVTTVRRAREFPADFLQRPGYSRPPVTALLKAVLRHAFVNDLGYRNLVDFPQKRIFSLISGTPYRYLSNSPAAFRKEGLSHERGILFGDVSALLPNLTEDSNNHTIEDIDDCKIVVFDLETTGLSKNDEICQISACTDDTLFNTYIIPSIPVSKGASAVTGLQLIDGDLYLHDERVESFPARDGFLKFLSYLQSFQCPIILLAHNGFKFDAPRIIRLAHTLKLINEFQSVVKGFADSLIITKHVLKKREQEKKRFSVAALANDFLPDEDTTTLHNAISDVKILNKIVHKINITDEIIKSHTKNINQILT